MHTKDQSAYKHSKTHVRTYQHYAITITTVASRQDKVNPLGGSEGSHSFCDQTVGEQKHLGHWPGSRG